MESFYSATDTIGLWESNDVPMKTSVMQDKPYADLFFYYDGNNFVSRQ